MKRKLVLLIFSITILSCNMYSDNDDLSDDFAEVCIKGHTYYIRSIGYKGYMSPKFNDNGTPVKCD